MGRREHYYTVSALQLLRGHLWVPARSLGFECFVVKGHCYGYFGIAPSLLRMPEAAVFGPGIKKLGFEELLFDPGFPAVALSGWWISGQLIGLWAPAASDTMLWVLGALRG